MGEKQRYSIDLFKRHSGALKMYLREAGIYFEPSEVGPLVHLECTMTEAECAKVNSFLDEYFEGVGKDA